MVRLLRAQLLKRPCAAAAALSAAAAAVSAAGAATSGQAAGADESSTGGRPTVLFTQKWGRFISRVQVQLKSEWRLVSNLDGVDPSDVKVVVGGGPDVLKIVHALPGVQLLQQPWTGTDWLDTSTVPAGCSVANVHGMDPPIAEYVIGTMLDNAIGFSKLQAEFRETGEFRPPFPGSRGPEYDGRPFHGELGGKTLGIVGLGSIGAEVARRAAAFDMRVIATTRSCRASLPPNVSWAGVGTGPDLDRLLEQSDYVLLACPLTDETHGLLNATRISKMKSTAVLVNVARGAVIVEEDLWSAMTRRQIAGAIIDVWWGEHVSGDVSQQGRPWHTLDNVAMTPHASGWTYEGAEGRRIADIAKNIDAIATGAPLLNLVWSGRV